MSFFAKLEIRARELDTLLCVGLDPHSQDLAEHTPAAARDFCLRLIDATADLALAFKPNTAFFEAFGAAGMQVLQEVISAVPEGVPVILDAKRGDIASTAEAYAQAAFTVLGADAITLSPYLGYDSLEPFIRDPEHGAFVLCKTSNPGAGDFQDLVTFGDGSGAAQALYEVVAALAQRWNSNDNLGLVVGATYPEALRRARLAAPDLWILAPGVGAQGGDLSAALSVGLRADGLGMLIPVSRAISRTADPRQAAESFRRSASSEKRTAHRNQESLSSNQPDLIGAAAPNRPMTHPQSRTLNFQPSAVALADALLAAGCVKFGQYTLKSGLVSPIYLDLRKLVSNPALLHQAAEAYLPLLGGLSCDRLAALPYAALPIGTALSLLSGLPLVYPRKEIKLYGTKAEIEGDYESGEQVVVIDDLATTGESKFEAIDRLTAAGLLVKDVIVLIDRQSGAAEALSARGFSLHSVFTLAGLLDYWEQNGRVPQEKILETRKFLSSAQR
jgi:uridine monophosphate synthetase